MKYCSLRLAGAALVCGWAAIAAHAQEDAETPPELDFLDTVLDDETEAVEAVRRFDLAQKALANWDVETAEKLKAEGRTDEAEERMEAARRRIGLINQAYRQLLNEYSDNARAVNFYGELLYDHLGDALSAIRSWRLAATYDETLSAPHNNLGLHYCHTGDYQMGLRELDKAMKLDPDHSDYHFNMAQIYLVNGPQVGKIRGWSKKKTYREAMKHSKRAAELAPDDYDLLEDYAVNFFAAENYGVDANWKDAAAAWASARTKARNKTEEFYTWLNEARVWIEQEDEERAEPCLESALAIIPDSQIAQQLLEKVRKDGD